MNLKWFPLIMCVSMLFLSSCSPKKPFSQSTFPLNKTLLFDSSNPVIYDNDDHRDIYTDEYLLALASTGNISIKYFITTYSTDDEYYLFVKGREDILAKAKASGLKHLPQHISGPHTALQRPATGKIEDTKALNSDAAKAIVQAASQATIEKPIVFVAGGQLTSLADAYLLDSTISKKIILSGIFGARDKSYNAGLDSWAWAIVLSKFRCLLVSDSDTDSLYNSVFKTQKPHTPKQQFKDRLENGFFPSTPFFTWLVEKRHPRHPAIYMEYDGDAPCAVILMRPDYIKEYERWKCNGLDSVGLPIVERDENGSLYLMKNANEKIGTEEFWRALDKVARQVKIAGKLP